MKHGQAVLFRCLHINLHKCIGIAFFFLLILSSTLGSELYGCDCCETCMCKLDICEAYLIK